MSRDPSSLYNNLDRLPIEYLFIGLGTMNSSSPYTVIDQNPPGSVGGISWLSEMNPVIVL